MWEELLTVVEEVLVSVVISLFFLSARCLAYSTRLT